MECIEVYRGSAMSKNIKKVTMKISKRAYFKKCPLVISSSILFPFVRLMLSDFILPFVVGLFPKSHDNISIKLTNVVELFTDCY